MSANLEDYRKMTPEQSQKLMARSIESNRLLILVCGIGMTFSALAGVVFICAILIKRGLVL